MTLHGMLNNWLPDRAATLRRIEEAATQLGRLNAEGFYNYQVRISGSAWASD